MTSTSEIPASSTQIPVFCPSCAARVAVGALPGTELRCPVCGTTFLASNSAVDTPQESTEATIIRNDAPRATTGSGRRLSTEEILLERLRSEPPPRQPVKWLVVAAMIAIVLAAGFGVYSLASKPNKFASDEKLDSTQLFSKRLVLGHTVDSIKQVLQSNPADLEAQVSLADAYYDASEWKESRQAYAAYLEKRPQNVDARVDYAYAIAQDTHDFKLALAEIDTGLSYDPNHLGALFNGGVLSTRLIENDNHEQALARTKSYFQRARVVAQQKAPMMAKQIDEILQEINKKGSQPTDPNAPPLQ